MKIPVSLKALAISLSIALVISLPNILGYLKSNSNFLFNSNCYIGDPWDINVYVSAISWSQKYGWGYENLYTLSDSKQGFSVYPLYTLVGILFKKQDPFVLYTLLHFLANFFFMVVFFLFCFFITNSQRKSLLASILFPFAGGLGWLMGNFGIKTADISITPFTYLTISEKPHSVLALSFYLLSFLFFLKLLKNGGHKYLLLSIITSTFFLIIYPYLSLSFLVITLITLVFFNIQKKIFNLTSFKKYIFLVLWMSFFSLAYGFKLLQTKTLNSVFSPRLGTPNIFLFIGGIGLFTIPLFKSIIKKSPALEDIFLKTFFFVCLFLLYTPLPFARYYLLGIFVPLTLLAVNFFENPKCAHRKVLFPLFLIFSTLTSISILLYNLLTVNSYSQQCFWNKNDLEAFEYIKTNLKDYDRAIANYPFSNFIPPLFTKKVYHGHLYQTPNFGEKILNANKLFNNQFSEEEALNFLKQNEITLLIYREEKDYWHNFPEVGVPSYGFLKTIYSNEKYKIFGY